MNHLSDCFIESYVRTLVHLDLSVFSKIVNLVKNRVGISKRVQKLVEVLGFVNYER